MKEKIYFNNLKAEDFLHPDDLSAISKIKKAKGIDLLINWIVKWSYEKVNRINLMGNAVRVTPKTYANIYQMVKLAANILDMPVPETFVTQSPNVNAYTAGTDSPCIVINSALIELMDQEELMAIIGHEMGHIKAGHVLYHTMARVLSMNTRWLGPLKIVFDYTLFYSLLGWSRKSELSADRAALLLDDPVFS